MGNLRNRMFTCSYKHIFPAGCYSGALFKGSSGRLGRENPDIYISFAAAADYIFNRAGKHKVLSDPFQNAPDRCAV